MTQGVELQPDPVGHTARAIQSAARKAHVLDDVPLAMKRSKVHRPFLVKRAISARGQEKQLEKELPWHAIPLEERELYKAAEEKQWNEHVQFEAVEKTVPAERILSSRFLYRDKNHAKRKKDPKAEPKAKARLCVAGQWDPDLGRIDMATDAPTVSRHSIILALLSTAKEGDPVIEAWTDHRGAEGRLWPVHQSEIVVDEAVD